MARVRDARTTRAGSHAEVEHQAGAGTVRGSVMQGSGMGEGGVGAPRARRQARLRAAAGGATRVVCGGSVRSAPQDNASTMRGLTTHSSLHLFGKRTKRFLRHYRPRPIHI
eukprot:3044087-Prymnesium_polylepis.1